MKKQCFFSCICVYFILFTVSCPAEEKNVAEKSQPESGITQGSSELTEEAWRALEQKKYDEALFYIGDCLDRFKLKALTQQALLTNYAPEEQESDYYALNDVATCLFIKGRIYVKQGKFREARAAFQEIMDSYVFAQCWDPRGWFWKVAEGAAIEIENIKIGMDFGEMSSSSLTSKAWEFYELEDYEKSEKYIHRCLALFNEKALAMQASLTDFASEGEEFDYWALNDVATCLFIRAKSHLEQGQKEEAKKVFLEIMENYRFAQCWDPRGWFWKPAKVVESEIDSLDIDFDFGDCSSETLTIRAWAALEKNNYRDIKILEKKCRDLYGMKALEMQNSLQTFASRGKEFEYWALNDVATCLFIRGKALRNKGASRAARMIFKWIIKHYEYAQCWDPRGWFWKVAQASKNEMDSMRLDFDFGDYSSETLTVKAWDALQAGLHRDVKILVWKCNELYSDKALKMQASLQDFAVPGEEFEYWALNDVSTSLFILARMYYMQGKNDRAERIYRKIIKNYSYAQCWDPRGWFWKPGEGAKDQILLMKTGIDFGDYTSMSLTSKAWQALEEGHWEEVRIYCEKCIILYSKFAEKMQEESSEYLSAEKAFDAWALNDVGTCYFILGEAYRKSGEYERAIEAYRMLIKKYGYSQCWDPQGWFWKPAIVSRARIHMVLAEQDINGVSEISTQISHE